MAKIDLTMDLNLKAYPNDLTPDVDSDYVVKVDTQTTALNVDNLADMAAARLGCEQTTARSVARVFMEEAARAVASGFCVSTPLFYVQPMASGVVMEEELSRPVDRAKVKVYGSFRQGALLAEAMANARLKLFLQPASTGPYIAGMVSATQIESGVRSADEPSVMQAGEMAVITGDKLKIIGDDPSVGILLTSVDNPSKSYLIPASKIAPNTPKKLQFVLPADIADGAWTLKVTTQFSNGKYMTKEPRSFQLSHPVYIGVAPETGGGGDDDGESPDPIV